MRGKSLRISGLDYVRVLSLSGIILYHCGVYLENHDILIGVLGTYGVYLFTVLSGFGLTVSMEGGNVTWPKYFMKRIKRIYPPYLLLLGIILTVEGIIGIVGRVDWWTVPLTILGFDGYLSYFIPFSSAFQFAGLHLEFYSAYRIGEWFLGFILIMYCLFPVIYSLSKRFGPLIVYLTILILTNLCHRYLIKFMSYSAVDVFPLGWRLSIFSLGVVLAFHRRMKPTARLLYFLPVTAAYLIANPLSRSLVWEAGYISLFFFFTNLTCSGFSRLDALFRMLGRYSYGMYLAHHYLIYRILGYFNVFSAGDFPIIAVFVFYTSLLVSWLLYGLLGTIHIRPRKMRALLGKVRKGQR